MSYLNYDEYYDVDLANKILKKLFGIEETKEKKVEQVKPVVKEEVKEEPNVISLENCANIELKAESLLDNLSSTIKKLEKRLSKLEDSIKIVEEPGCNNVKPIEEVKAFHTFSAFDKTLDLCKVRDFFTKVFGVYKEESLGQLEVANDEYEFSCDVLYGIITLWAKDETIENFLKVFKELLLDTCLRNEKEESFKQEKTKDVCEDTPETSLDEKICEGIACSKEECECIQPERKLTFTTNDYSEFVETLEKEFNITPTKNIHIYCKGKHNYITFDTNGNKEKGSYEDTRNETYTNGELGIAMSSVEKFRNNFKNYKIIYSYKFDVENDVLIIATSSTDKKKKFNRFNKNKK